MSGPKPDFMDPFDDCSWLPARELLRRLGYEPLPPIALDSFQLPGRLWEFIYAMAGRRFYLHYTDHLGDRELYAWLHEQWLGERVADITPDAEWDCNVCVLDLGNGNERDEEFWLRHYAGPKEREAWALENGRKAVPPHQGLPHDRDRWLPVQPGLPPEGDEEELFPSAEDVEDDPLGLKTVDAEIRAEHEREDAIAIAGGEAGEGWQRPIDQLQRTGAAPIPPAELTDETLTAKLWELLHHLACRGFYVLHTDHLSDRELYTALWKRGLRDDALMPGKRCRTGGWFHDFVGRGSEEDNQVWLRFYATDEDRADHVKDWPNDPMPLREKPPFNRDWRLPKAPF